MVALLLLTLTAQDSLSPRELLLAGKGTVRLHDGTESRMRARQVNLRRGDVTFDGRVPITRPCGEIASFTAEPEFRRQKRGRARAMIGWGVAGASLALSFRSGSYFVEPSLFVLSPAIGWLAGRAIVPVRPQTFRLVCP